MNQFEKNLVWIVLFCVTLFTIVPLGANKVFAHCDTMDGPVVKAAKRALETGNVNFVLIWVQKGDEAEIKKAFQKTLAVRKLSPEAKELADMYFFETFVRIHRAGEGAPYTGLKPAGLNLGPVIPTADRTLETGLVESLVQLLTNAVQDGIREQFKEVMAKKNFNPDDIEAGREYVKAYVEFIHYVERIYETTKSPEEGEHHESEEGGGHK
jgi:hypothetical protein